jgi:hypothetical protein
MIWIAVIATSLGVACAFPDLFAYGFTDDLTFLGLFLLLVAPPIPLALVYQRFQAKSKNPIGPRDFAMVWLILIPLWACACVVIGVATVAISNFVVL